MLSDFWRRHVSRRANSVDGPRLRSTMEGLSMGGYADIGETTTAAPVPGDPALAELVNTERYPLCTAPGNEAWKALVAAARDELAADGCCVLPDFVRPGRVERLRAECAALAPLAYYGEQTVNVYNTTPDTPLPPGHPARVTMRRGNAFVARDRIPAGHPLQSLYTSAAFQAFVAACFGLPAVHELADPLAGLCLNVVEPGREHPWHFDTNEFAVSLLTQAAAHGGEFEYCPGIRSVGAENFDDVAAVLAGRAEGRVRRLAPRAGDLQLFLGRYSLHRVRQVAGPRQRHTAIFAYTERPDVIGSVARTRQLFGRVLPDHLAGRAGSARVDALLD
jgi:hypothetical protein